MFQDIGKGVDTCMQKHPYKIQYHVCNIYCVSETTPFIWPAEKRFEFAMVVKQSFLGEFCSQLQKSSDIWQKGTPPFTSWLMSHTVNDKKKSSLCSLTGIFGTSSHHCQPLNVLVPSFWYFPHRMSCMWVLKLAVLLAKLPFWLDITWTLTQRGEFCDHLTSLINKSSVAK